jgi:hypothetical protein
VRVTVRAARSGQWWALRVPELPGLFTQVRRLDQAPAMVADAVATLEGLDVAEIEIDLEVELPDEVQSDLDHARDARRRAAVLDQEASLGFIDVARRLVDSGMTLREVGTVLGVSSQRAGQLVGSVVARR